MFRSLILAAGMMLLTPGFGLAAGLPSGTCLDLSPDAAFVEAMMAPGEQRVALVIGNGGYEAISRLPNPPNDAEAVAARLQRVGFRVFVLLDGGATAVSDCLRIATPNYEGADIGLLYYAGHGIQVRDENFVVGVDAPADLDAAAGLVPVTSLIDPIRKARVALIFLDACRTNPYDDTAPQGLAVADARIVPIVKPGELDTIEGSQPTGMMIAYATSPNAVALDGNGDHSPFTEAFLEEVGRPGHSLQQSLSEIGKLVGDATDFTQTPWSRSSLTSLLFMNGTIEDEEVSVASGTLMNRAYQLLQDGDKQGALVAALKAFPASLTADSAEPFTQTLGYMAGLIGSDVLKLDEASSKMRVNNIAFSLDGKRTAFMLEDPAGSGSKTGELQIFNRVTGEKISSGELITFFVNDLLYFTQDSTKLVAADDIRNVWVWDATSGQLLTSLREAAGPAHEKGKNPQVESVVLNTEASLVAAISSGADFLRVTEFATGKVLVSVREEDLGTPAGDIEYASFNAYSSKAAFGDSDRSVVMSLVGTYCGNGVEFLHYDLASGKLTHRVTAKFVLPDECQLKAGSFSADGRRALVETSISGQDTQLDVVDTVTGDILYHRVGRGEWGHVLTPDGTALYVPARYMGGGRLLIPLGDAVSVETEGLIAQESASAVAHDGIFSGMGDPLQALRWYHLPPGVALLDALEAQLSDQQRSEVEAERLKWFPLP